MIITEEKFDITIEEKKLTLILKNSNAFSNKDFKTINNLFKDYVSKSELINQFEVDFTDTFFEISDFAEKLIRKSCLIGNNNLLITLRLGSHNLPNRLNCLYYLRMFNIDRYRINYY